VYTQGETLDIGGLVVTGTYSDGTSKQETVSLSNISGYNPNLVGQQTLTVTLNGKTASFTVTVNAGGAVLQSIAITSQPTKTVYTEGEAFEIGGLVVTGTYSDSTSKQETVSLSNVSGYNPNLVGQQTLTVTLNGKTASFTVTVNASGAVLQSIAITSPPTKTVYTEGETLEIGGLVVTGTYSDGTSKQETVGPSNVSGYNANTAGPQTQTVTLSGKTAYFTVTVNASVPATAVLSLHLDDPLLDELTDAIVLSKNGTPASLTLEIVGAYASYQWLLNDRDTPVSTSASYVLNAADCPLGANSLVVQVRTPAGAYYSREITFIVNREGE
jgi:cytochrome c-type biogenesis protein CcmE